ncbi:MAG: PQQ-binding-like beta-propeller repeat protein [Planctomycetota bacterium]
MKTTIVSGIAALLLAATASAPAAAATGQPAASVSLFTTHNRGLFRRGDPVDLFWCVRNGVEQPAADGTVTLAGRDLRVGLGRIALPKRQAGGRVSGYLKLDTASLAPGEYEVSAELAGAASYPVRFRICQREPLSDYVIYSHVFGQAAPCCGSPVNAYYGSIPGGPGLDPIMKEVDASLDPALAAKAADPAGPAPEKFARPTANEANLMALAALGMRAMPQYPTLSHQEDWNPKHTLPEDLAQMRRRLALFVQPLADVAGLEGVMLGWYASMTGAWEGVPCLDGHQAKRNETAIASSKAQMEEEVKKAAAKGASERDQEAIRQRAGFRAGSTILANAWVEYMADVKQLAPHLSGYNAIPSWWMTGWTGDPVYAFRNLPQRQAIDYSDYGLTAWGNFRVPAWMSMGNPEGQKLLCNFMANQIHNRVVTSFCATGRGLDGFAMPCIGDYPQGEDVALRKIFERFGSYFSALEPLPDVALYRSSEEDGNALNVAMHDLARLRRPAMMVSYEDVLDGKLSKYRVLFLVNQKKPLASGISKAVEAFEDAGGIIVKDRTCHDSLPGRDIGFGYEGPQVHPVWGLAYANGEAEFAHLWKNFKETREKFLVEAFARIPGLPVTTADPDAVISPLAGQESILCFVANQTLVPLSLEGKWRQYLILPKNNELLVENGWHVRNLLTGKPAAMEKTATGQKTAVDFTRASGAIFLLTKREPTKMAARTERTAPATVRLTGWLADSADKPLVDPLPFEVTLRAPDGSVLFHKFAALSPDLALEVPVPARSKATPLELEVRDLVLGSAATVPLDPAPPATVSRPDTIDLVGGAGPIAAFLRERKGPVTVLLGEGQDAFRPAAEQLAALLKKAGRPSRVVQWNPADVQPLTLRWKPTEQETAIVAGLAGGQGFAERIVGGNNDPNTGYDEYGPRLRHDADIVLFGTPATSLPVKQLVPYLRREPSESYPSAGGFFVHSLWSPFQGGYDGLYVGCRDAAGANAAVAALANVKPAPRAAAAQGTAAPVVTAGGPPTPLEDMLTGKFGQPVLNIAFTPDGKRVFATSAGYGDAQLFALSSDGKVQETRPLHHSRGGLYQFVRAPLQALDDRTVEVGIMGTQYRFSLDKGFISKAGGAAAVPGHSGRLSINNDAFDRNGPTARVALRPTTDGADRELPVAGRVTDSLVMADGQSVLLATARGETLRLAAADGRVLWRAATPSGGILRLAPDGKTVWVGACDGVIHRLDAATGKPLGTTDLNPYNVTTPERFAQQMNAAPDPSP